MENKLSELSKPEQFDAEVEIHGGEPFAVWAPAVNGSHVKKEQYFALLAELEDKVWEIKVWRKRCENAEKGSDYAQQRIAELEAKTAMTMGVGSGNGNLFVHGDYDSIKAAQAIVLENESLRAKLATPVRLPALLHPESDAVNGMIFANGRNDAIAECSVAIRQAGFLSEASPMTVEGGGE
ncbi:hypothetical protein [Serratia sp. ser-z]